MVLSEVSLIIAGSDTDCAAILAMLKVPHWEDGHVEDIRSIRKMLEPDGFWNDVSMPCLWRSTGPTGV